MSSSRRRSRSSTHRSSTTMATGFDLNDLLKQARSRWLESAEVLFMLKNHDSKMIMERVPQQPTGGSWFFYNKNITPSFRRDGHNWCKKPNKNTASEGHEKLKVDGFEAVQCYYAKREDSPDFMRRSYWMLDKEMEHIVLVHYRDTSEGKTNSASMVKSSAGPSCTFTQSINRFALEYQEAEPACLEVALYETNPPGRFPMLPHPVQAHMSQLGAHSSLTTAPRHKFEIKKIVPKGGFANESTEVLIIGSFHCDPSELAWAVFGGSEVPIKIVQDGVICCHAPPNCPGIATFCILSANWELCSEVKEFEYRDKYIRPLKEKAGDMEEFKLLDEFVQMLQSDFESSSNSLERSLLLTARRTSSGTEDRVLQELLKSNLRQWLFARSFQAGGSLSCNLSKNEKEVIIRTVGGLGYEWALGLLLSSGIGVDFPDSNGWTALHWAARFGREQMVSALIRNGAEVSAITNPTAEHPRGQTPTSIAYAYGHIGLGPLCVWESPIYYSFYIGGEASSVHVEAQVDVNNISKKYSARFEGVSSLSKELVKVRNALKNVGSFHLHSSKKESPSNCRQSHRRMYYSISEDESSMGAVRLTLRKAVNYTGDELGASILEDILDESSLITVMMELGFALEATEHLEEARVFDSPSIIQGHSGYKRQKPDTISRGKAKLVDVSDNEEESASLVGTSLMDNDNVDPFQLPLVSTSPMSNDNVDPFQLPLVSASPTGNDNVDPFQLPLVGTSPTGNDNVDPFQLPLVGTSPTGNDNVDPFQLPLVGTSPTGNDNVDPFQLPLDAPLYSPGYMELMFFA